MITTMQQAEAELTAALADYAADMGKPAPDDAWYDFVIATAQSIAIENPSIAGRNLARVFCRGQIGTIPPEVEGFC